MGEVFFGVPENLARAVVREMGLRGAVETGTHLGDSAVKLREFVPEVWTVELSEAYVERARERHRDADGVHFLQGSSDVVLRELAPTFTDPMLYWLDAHWCEVDTAGSDRQCPVLGEIAALDEGPSAADSVDCSAKPRRPPSARTNCDSGPRPWRTHLLGSGRRLP